MTEPNAPITGWPQPGDPAPPQRSRQGRLVIAILSVVVVLWLFLGLGVVAMLTVATGEGFVELFWVWVVGLIAWPVLLQWTKRRTRLPDM